MQHTVSHSTAVQHYFHNRWYVLNGKQWYQLPEFIPAIRILASTAASASPSTLSMSHRQQNLSTNSSFALAPISTLVRPALVTATLSLHFLCALFWQHTEVLSTLLTDPNYNYNLKHNYKTDILVLCLWQLTDWVETVVRPVCPSVHHLALSDRLANELSSVTKYSSIN